MNGVCCVQMENGEIDVEMMNIKYTDSFYLLYTYSNMRSQEDPKCKVSNVSRCMVYGTAIWEASPKTCPERVEFASSLPNEY